ncbi:hypothetical protein JKY72_01460 [Candidatus Gracilibacteria bacterium]|nr:hypothetical protein [Candidatus Gracilibacteria bacterium]
MKTYLKSVPVGVVVMVLLFLAFTLLADSGGGPVNNEAIIIGMMMLVDGVILKKLFKLSVLETVISMVLVMAICVGLFFAMLTYGFSQW